MQQRIVNSNHDARPRLDEPLDDQCRETQPELVDGPHRVAEETMRPRRPLKKRVFE
jgi:hypothetical protein